MPPAKRVGRRAGRAAKPKPAAGEARGEAEAAAAAAARGRSRAWREAGGHDDPARRAAADRPRRRAAHRSMRSRCCERTRTVGGRAATRPDFTLHRQTRPTADEAEQVIEHAADEVLGRLPTHIAPQYLPAVTRAISLRAAQLIEQSYYRENALQLGEA